MLRLDGKLARIRSGAYSRSNFILAAALDSEMGPGIQGAGPARTGEPPVLVADVSRLHGATGFQPRFKIEDTLAAALSYWRAVEHT